MINRPNLLVICGKNKRRSRTAESIFRNDSRFNIRSAGVSPKSNRKITESDLNWADIVLVMETAHRAKIGVQYGHLALPPVKVLDIPDVYEFMDDELIDILTGRINEILENKFEL